MPFKHCPICGTELSNSDRVTRWCHDIMMHRGYWQTQTENMTKDQLEEDLFEIVRYYFRK